MAVDPKLLEQIKANAKNISNEDWNRHIYTDVAKQQMSSDLKTAGDNGFFSKIKSALHIGPIKPVETVPLTPTKPEEAPALPDPRLANLNIPKVDVPSYFNAVNRGSTPMDYFTAASQDAESLKRAQAAGFKGLTPEQETPALVAAGRFVGGFASTMPFQHVTMPAPKEGDWVGYAAEAAGGLAGTLVGLGGIKNLLGGLGIFNEEGLTFLKGNAANKVIRFAEEKLPTISKFIFQDVGFDTILDDALKLSVSFGIQTNLSTPAGTPFKDRLRDTVKNTLWTLPMVAFGAPGGLVARSSMNAALGAAMSLQSDGNLEHAAIQSALWGALGSMGGVNRVTSDIAGEKTYSYAKKAMTELIPEAKEDIKKLESLESAPAGEIVPVPGETIPLTTNERAIQKIDALKNIEKKVDSKVTEYLQGLSGKKVVDDLSVGSGISLSDIYTPEEMAKFQERITEAGIKEEFSKTGVPAEEIASFKAAGQAEGGGTEYTYKFKKKYSKDVQLAAKKILQFIGGDKSSEQLIKDYSKRYAANEKEVRDALENYTRSEVPAKRGKLAPDEGVSEEGSLSKSTLDEQYNAEQDFKNEIRRKIIYYSLMGKNAEELPTNLQQGINDLENGRDTNDAKAVQSSLRKFFNDPRQLNSFLNRAVKAIFESKSPSEIGVKAAQIKLDSTHDWPKLQEAIDAFAKTDGSEQSLIDSIAKTFGIKSGQGKMKFANDILSSYGLGDSEAFLNRLKVSYPDVFAPINRLQANFKALDAYHMNGELFDVEPTFFSNEEIKQIPEAAKKGDIFPIDSEKYKELDSAKSIEMRIMDKLNSAFLFSKLRPGIAGQMEGSEVMRLSNKSYYTWAHEAGHNIDAKYGIIEPILNERRTNNLYSRLYDELSNGMDVGKRTSPLYLKIAEKSGVPLKDVWVKEGFGDMLRRWLLGEPADKLSKDFKLSMPYFEQVMKNLEPNLFDTLSEARESMTKIKAAPIYQRRMAAMYENGEGSIFNKVVESLKNPKDTFQGFKDFVRDIDTKQLRLLNSFATLDKFHNTKDTLNSFEDRAATMAQRGHGASSLIWDAGIPKNPFHLIDFTPPTKMEFIPGTSLREIFKSVPNKYSRIASVYLNMQAEIVGAQKMMDRGEEPIIAQGESLQGLQKEVKQLEEGLPFLQDLGKSITNFNSHFRKALAGLGIIDQDYLDVLEQYPRFATLARTGGFADNDFKINLNFFNTVTKTLRGSQRDDFVDPFIGLMSEVSSMMNLAVKNDMYQHIALFAKDKSHKLANIEPVAPIKPINVHIDEAMNLLKEMKALSPEAIDALKKVAMANPEAFAKAWRPHATADENVKQVKMPGGETVYLRLDKTLSDFMQAQNTKAHLIFDNAILKGWTVIKRNLATTFSPSFLAKNPMRDALDAMIQSSSGFIPFVDSAKGLAHFIKGTRGGFGADPVYDAAKYKGLEHNTLMSEGNDPIRDTFLQLQKSSTVKDKLKYGFQAFELLAKWSEGSEMMTRLGVLGKGKYDLNDPLQLMKGIRDAQEATFNWTQRGMSSSGVSQINKIDSFFKAQLVAFEKQFRMLTGEHAARTYKRMIPIQMASFLYSLALRNNKDYWNIPMFRQMMSINIPKKDGSFFPIPFTGNLYFVMAWAAPQYFYHWAFTKMGWSEKDGTEVSINGKKETVDYSANKMKDAALSILSNVLPGNVDITQTRDPNAPLQMNLINKIEGTLIPDLFKGFFENYHNMSMFTGKEIVPQYLKDLPPDQQISDTTSNMGIELSRGWNSVMPFKVSPIQMDNLLRNGLFGLFDFTNGYIDLAAQKLGISQNQYMKQKSILSVWPLSTFYHEQYSPNMSYGIQKVQDRYLAYQKINNSYNRILKDDPIKAMEYMKQNKTAITQYDLAAAAHSSIIDLEAHYRTVQGDSGISDSVKQTELDKTRTLIQKIADQTNVMLDSMERWGVKSTDVKFSGDQSAVPNYLESLNQ